MSLVQIRSTSKSQIQYFSDDRFPIDCKTTQTISYTFFELVRVEFTLQLLIETKQAGVDAHPHTPMKMLVRVEFTIIESALSTPSYLEKEGHPLSLKVII